MRWSVGAYGVKDFFTLVNLLGGVAAIVLAMEGEPLLAGYALIAGFVLGDALDGQVARATNTGNRFGAEFDSAADGVSQGVAPAIIVYRAYEMGGHQWLGLGLMALLIATGVIRQARFAVHPFDYPLCYLGLPRTISGFVAMAYVNSTIWFEYSGFGFEMGTVIIILMAALNLVPIPYMTHKGKRRMQLSAKIAAWCYVLAPPLAFFFARDFTFDVLFLLAFGYVLTGWMPIQIDERRAFYDEYRRWSGQVATLR